MLSVAKQNPVPAEPGKTIVQVWKTGKEAHEHQQVRAKNSTSTTHVGLLPE
jgi:hypothetical protein